MHGLNQIQNQNTQAAIDEQNRAKKNALANGYSYVCELDSLGKPDITKDIQIFATAEQLKAHVIATVPAFRLKDYAIVFGRN